MDTVGFCFLLLMYSSLTHGFSKYGRTCKDIGCLSNEECVMENDPCSYYQRQNECGSYPTCKPKANSGPRTCKDFVCPPSQVCRLDGTRPRCYDDHSKAGRVGYDTSELKNNPSGGNLYPNIPRGETTPRPISGVVQPSHGGVGYQGGQIGSGYPGYPNTNNQQPPRHPYQNTNNGGYPQQQQPAAGYPNYPGGYYNGYPQQGYPQQGYPQQGYPNNYNYQNGYNPYQQNPYYPQNRNSGSSSGGFVDKLTDALKSYGLFYMVVAYFYQRIFLN